MAANTLKIDVHTPAGKKDGSVELPAELTSEVQRLGMSADPLTGPREQRLAYALERAAWWRSYGAFGVTPAQARVAHVVHRAYFLLWQGLSR